MLAVTIWLLKIIAEMRDAGNKATELQLCVGIGYG